MFTRAKEGMERDTEDIRDTNSRVLRGGWFFIQASLLRSATRIVDVPAYRYSYFGFRLARTFTP